MKKAKKNVDKVEETEVDETEELENDENEDGMDDEQSAGATPRTRRAPLPVGRQGNGEPRPANTTMPADATPNNADAHLTEDAKATKAALAEEPQVSYYIPLGFGERAGAVETVSINGYKHTIKKGVRVMIPESFAKLLDDYLGIQENVGQDKRIEGNPEKENALL